MTISRQHKGYVRTSKRFLAILDRVVASDPPCILDSRDSATDLVTDFLFLKAYTTYRAIHLLASRGFGQDACILVRSLFEILVSLEYLLSEDSEGRARRFLQYEKVLSKQMLDRIDSLEAEGVDVEFVEFRDTIVGHRKEIEQDYEEVRRTLGLKSSRDELTWAGLSVGQMARATGLIEDYLTVYWVFSNIQHSNIQSARAFAKTDGRGQVCFEPSDIGVAEALTLGYKYMLRMFERWSAVFRLKRADEIALARHDLAELGQ